MNRDFSESFKEQHALLTRRQLFGRGASGLGLAALSSLLGSDSLAAPKLPPSKAGLPGLPHFQPRAKRVIFLCQSGAPSQVDLFDPKPGLQKWHGEELPDSVRMNQRLTGMTASQKTKPVTASPFKFKPAGKRHGMSKRSNKFIRNTKKSSIMSPGDVTLIDHMLPYNK